MQCTVLIVFLTMEVTISYSTTITQLVAHCICTRGGSGGEGGGGGRGPGHLPAVLG